MTRDSLRFVEDGCDRIEELLARRMTVRACVQLLVLTRLEQELLLPAARECSPDEDAVDEADAGVDALRDLVAQVLALPDGEPLRDAKLAVLANTARRHFVLLRDAVMPHVRASHPDPAGLGRGMRRRRDELEAVTEALREEAVALSFTA